MVFCRHGRGLLLLVLLPLTSCSQAGTPEPGLPPVSPQEETERLLFHLASLDPVVAASPAETLWNLARAEATGMATLEEMEWVASRLSEEDPWASDEPNTRLLGTNGISQVLAEARQINPGGGLMTEDQQRAQREYLAGAMFQVFTDDGGADAKRAHEEATARQREVRFRKVEERQKELLEAARWVQFTQVWSIYYAAASPNVPGASHGPVGPEVALDQAVSMSLGRPDFLRRLSILMDESMKEG